MSDESLPRFLERAGWFIAAIVLLAIVMLAWSSARAADSVWTIPGADAKRGPQLLQQFGCAACHTIPGVSDARGNVGPPLTGMADRTYIAGILRNTPENLVKWIRDPQSIVPGNAMPSVGISETDARAIAAYLYTLH